MKKNILFLFLFFVISIPSVLGFAGGNGSVEAPFEISTCEELQNIHEQYRQIGQYVNPIIGIVDNFVLVNDIDCSDTVNWENGFHPIGKGEGTGFFAGTLDGKGYTISNMYTSTIFYRLYGGEIKNIVFDNVTMNDSLSQNVYSPIFDDVWAYQDDRMQYVDEKFSNKIRISNITVINTNVERTQGSSFGGHITDFGILLGVVGGGEVLVEDCAVIDANLLVQSDNPEGNVWGIGLLAGGVYASQFGDIEFRRNYVTGSLTAISNDLGSSWDYVSVGGLIGASYGVLIEDSFARVNITANGKEVGGLIGSLGFMSFDPDKPNIIRRSYAAGKIISLDNSPQVDPFIGAELKPETTILEGNFFDAYKSGFNSGRAFGLTTASMKSGKNFINTGWNFVDVWGINSAINEGYPNLEVTGIIVDPVNLPRSSGGGGWIEEEVEVIVYVPVSEPSAPLFALLGDGEGIDSTILILGLVAVALIGSYFLFRKPKARRGRR